MTTVGRYEVREQPGSFPGDGYGVWDAYAHEWVTSALGSWSMCETDAEILAGDLNPGGPGQ